MAWWVPAVWLFLSCFHLIVSVSNHGKSSGEYSGPGAFVTICFLGWLYWYGGFFSVWLSP